MIQLHLTLNLLLLRKINFVFVRTEQRQMETRKISRKLERFLVTPDGSNCGDGGREGWNEIGG